mmetsp:Transcript_37209/g.86801  ORF Transcript_37209/g.86801 Transcript_37209/m.86801 type:complete len:503 (-) Transcript_37209:270-1778(-)|eukprot:CAMPEP_0113309236 /NCGR_PEP_ID=MMETSP0010_2-20120614/7365_1 /TAXON_ID=216773 ORGANISM="Corethron hystrix, Strain 308" /NCGR_SAMPLE_ID=MMETSP0010_2 /ASSEMBLY_ACC=CAM_ASM_000155 /LENGTH=502 /DNA_ID=CAMNT_0000164457 /DNA_START=113 /DNA_END=1621 /DNA_ORIENTATION=+ /assembly_acc=CAM_ASM_000155
MIIFEYFLLALATFMSTVQANEECRIEPLEYSDTIAMEVRKIGSIPTTRQAPFSYNMMPADNFDDALYFMDQLEGKIYSYDENNEEPVELVFDIAEDKLPAGINLDWSFPHSAALQKIHAMAQGANKKEVYVVHLSSTLPAGWTEADAKLPAKNTYHGYACGGVEFVPDLYRFEKIPACFKSATNATSFTAYEVFTKYTVKKNKKLTDPQAFFVSETSMVPGHFGGGIATYRGKILWSTGDCLPYGLDGHYAPQLDHEACGKILLIDPVKRSYKVAAKGVRNSQQFRIISKGKKINKKSQLVFMDIGGVTAEEVNSEMLGNILNTKDIENFGWGRNIYDGKAREGTFYVAPGKMGILGTEPPCASNAVVGEDGYKQPWIQFGRSTTDLYYAISSFAISKKFKNIKLLWTEFNTGAILGTMSNFYQVKDEEYMGPSKAYKIKLFDENGSFLEDGLNGLVKEELGEVGFYRGDPRMFHFQDGNAGVFIERTGMFYQLNEITMPK